MTSQIIIIAFAYKLQSNNRGILLGWGNYSSWSLYLIHNTIITMYILYSWKIDEEDVPCYSTIILEEVPLGMMCHFTWSRFLSTSKTRTSDFITFLADSILSSTWFLCSFSLRLQKMLPSAKMIIIARHQRRRILAIVVEVEVKMRRTLVGHQHQHQRTADQVRKISNSIGVQKLPTQYWEHTGGSTEFHFEWIEF